VEVFEPAEGSLNNIAAFVHYGIKAIGLLAVTAIGDVGFDVFGSERDLRVF